MYPSFSVAFGQLEQTFNGLRPMATNPAVTLEKVVTVMQAAAVCLQLATREGITSEYQMRAGLLAQTMAEETRSWLRAHQKDLQAVRK